MSGGAEIFGGFFLPFPASSCFSVLSLFLLLEFRDIFFINQFERSRLVRRGHDGRLRRTRGACGKPVEEIRRFLSNLI
ncbi:MAG: hypothetical protein D6679_11625 [Candidatus Hydrogenedentota bacterium]|nr:MAG: hypothetical protein D6679_11625 [Candidatus Hydrogenedentota bacterium]